jgi:hypothetical protein
MIETLNKTNANASEKPDWLEVVRQHVESLRFGVVQIVVHDSLVTQIDKTERVRLDKPAPRTNKQTKTKN